MTLLCLAMLCRPFCDLSRASLCYVDSLVTLAVFGCYVSPLVTFSRVWLCYVGPLVTLAVFGYVM